jgi:hypothetical protein
LDLQSYESEDEQKMHLIETLFHISPDGGSGMTEAMFLAIPVAICVFLVMRRIKRSQRRTL